MKSAEIMSHEDWVPTLMAAAGVPDIVGKLKKGYNANGKDWKVHLDGYDFTSHLAGKAKKGPREQILYFSQGGELNAVRWNDWKVHFAVVEGNIATGVRETPGWPVIYNLKADPYEEMTFRESMFSARWYADQMWLFVPIQAKVQEFLASLEGYPFQPGSSLGADGINYRSLKAIQILQQMEKSGFPVGR
jgi:arylsulfatase